MERHQFSDRLKQLGATLCLITASHLATGAELLWRHEINGSNWLYQTNGTTITPQQLPSVAPSWDPYRGDFDGNGSTDILWRDFLTGQNWIHMFDNGQRTLSTPLNAIPNEWKVAAIGDFNGDGKDDILWRHDLAGTLWIYLMDGPAIANSFSFIDGAEPNWQVAGAPDLNGDGTSDILLRHRTEQTNYVFLMKDGEVASHYELNNISNNWKISAFGDWNGDGTDDILWREISTGLNWIHLMQDGKLQTAQQLNQISQSAWHWDVVDVADFDGNGSDDLLWRNNRTGTNVIYYLDQGKLSHVDKLNEISGLNWKAVPSAASRAHDTSSEVNPGLPGRLFIQDWYWAGYYLNHQTGLYDRLPNSSWTNHKDIFPLSASDLIVVPSSYDGEEIMLGSSGCVFGATAWDYSCFTTQDRYGNYSFWHTDEFDVLGPTKLSRDRQYYASYKRLGFLSGDEHAMAVFDRAGKLVAGNLSSNSPFDWLPDNRIIMAKDSRTFAITHPMPYIAVTAYTMTLPDAISGSLSTIRISPDGKRIAFFMLSGSTPFSSVRGVVYIMNLDGSRIMQVADVPADDSSSASIHSPHWSPDGKWLLLKVGGSRPQDPNSLGTLPYMYAVPTNLNYPAILDWDDAKMSPNVVRLQRTWNFNDGFNDRYLREGFSNDNYYWVP